MKRDLPRMLQWALGPGPSLTCSGKKKKGKGSGSSFLPKPLLGMGAVAKTAKGNAICFNYNLKKCDVHGQRCSKGLHICAVKGCHKAHAAIDCPKKATE